MKILIAVLFILHGMITAAQSAGCLKPGNPIQNPAWLNWWPTGLGQSWLLTKPGPVMGLGGVLYLVGGAALILAGLGLLGWIVPQAWWPPLAAAGSALSLLMLVVYLHPFYLIGMASSLAVLVSIYWIHWPSFMRLLP